MYFVLHFIIFNTVTLHNNLRKFTINYERKRSIHPNQSLFELLLTEDFLLCVISTAVIENGLILSTIILQKTMKYCSNHFCLLGFLNIC